MYYVGNQFFDTNSTHTRKKLLMYEFFMQKSDIIFMSFFYCVLSEVQILTLFPRILGVCVRIFLILNPESNKFCPTIDNPFGIYNTNIHEK